MRLKESHTPIAKPNPASRRQELAGASARFPSGEQLVDRAEKFRLWARLFGRPLSLETSPQPKARRLSRVATPAVLPAANPATALLHRSSLVQSEGPSDAEVWCSPIAGANEIRTLGPRGRQRLRDRPLLLFRRSCSRQKQQLHREGPRVRIRVPPAESLRTIGSSAARIPSRSSAYRQTGRTTVRLAGPRNPATLRLPTVPSYRR